LNTFSRFQITASAVKAEPSWNFTPVAQAEGPQGLVGVVHLPRRGEAGDQLARPVGDIELPGDQRIVEREAGELVGTGAAVGLARRQGHVGHRDAEAHHLLLRECRDRQGRQGARRQ
jgi:hypothetical protein